MIVNETTRFIKTIVLKTNAFKKQTLKKRWFRLSFFKIMKTITSLKVKLSPFKSAFTFDDNFN